MEKDAKQLSEEHLKAIRKYDKKKMIRRGRLKKDSKTVLKK